jgi:hypothetical protein
MNTVERHFIFASSPGHATAIAEVDAFDAETQRLKVRPLRMLWLALTGCLCWRCRCQESDKTHEYALCSRCQKVLEMLEHVQ